METWVSKQLACQGMAGLHESLLIECALILSKLCDKESTKWNNHKILHSATEFFVYFKVGKKFELGLDGKNRVHCQAGCLLGVCSEQVDEA